MNQHQSNVLLAPCSLRFRHDTVLYVSKDVVLWLT